MRSATLAIIPLCLAFAAPAFPQGYPMPSLGGDDLAMVSTEYGAQVSYLNAYPASSNSGGHTLEAGGLSVHVIIRTNDGPETIIVRPPPGCTAYPERAEVDDGQGIDIDVVCEIEPVS